MARAKKVEKARKDYPDAGIKKGDTYYWWKFRYGGKRMSKTPPRPSQLTQSAHYSGVRSIQESIEDGCFDQSAADDLESAVDDVKSQLEELRDAAQDSFDNMPEGLQQGDVGQQLEARVESMESAISDFEDVDIDVDEQDMRSDVHNNFNIDEDEKKWTKEEIIEALEGHTGTVDATMKKADLKQDLLDLIESAVIEAVEERIREIADELEAVDIEEEG